MMAGNNSQIDDQPQDDGEDEIFDDNELDIEEFNGNVSGLSLARPSKHKKDIEELNRVDVGFDSGSQ